MIVTVCLDVAMPSGTTTSSMYHVSSCGHQGLMMMRFTSQTSTLTLRAWSVTRGTRTATCSTGFVGPAILRLTILGSLLET